MKNNKLLKTNLQVSFILIVGFVLTAALSYHANYQSSLNNIEQVSALSAEGIYHQLSTLFSKPVNISLTMAHDSLLVDHLENENEHLEDEAYVETTKDYLEAYRKKYGFDSVFLVSTNFDRYYNFNGLDRILERDNPENTWYFDLLDSDLEYTLVVDNDEVSGADNSITVFVNCKIQGTDGATIGIVGVGIRVNYLKELLKEYEDKFAVKASLISKEGRIEISTTYTGYEKMDWFAAYGQEDIRSPILNWNDDEENMEIWTHSDSWDKGKSFVVSRYIPELSWNLIVEQNTEKIVHKMYLAFYRTCLILALVIAIIVIIITVVIRNFDRQITKLVEERQTMFKKATEHLYDSIYEFNLTKNCYVGKATEEYFASLGAAGVPFDQGLKMIAQKQVKAEYREGYVTMFSPQNAIREYEMGNSHLRYDMMITQDGSHYHWMRLETYLFLSEEDHCIHMFSYRKNIDREKEKELLAQTDEMTGFLTKAATERFIDKKLEEKSKDQFALFIFDFDNFKQVNDRFGHAFGDFCIRRFTATIKAHFSDDGIFGRIGGDEFVAFIPFLDITWLEKKAKALSRSLDMVCLHEQAQCAVTASIGISICPQAGVSFDLLYHCADKALYQTKAKGKNGYTIFDCAKS